MIAEEHSIDPHVGIHVDTVELNLNDRPDATTAIQFKVFPVITAVTPSRVLSYSH